MCGPFLYISYTSFDHISFIKDKLDPFLKIHALYVAKYIDKISYREFDVVLMLSYVGNVLLLDWFYGGGCYDVIDTDIYYVFIIYNMSIEIHKGSTLRIQRDNGERIIYHVYMLFFI